MYVGGRRLTKTPTTVYDPLLGQDSYKFLADKTIEAEFTVENKENCKSVRLTVPPQPGELVVILLKRGKTWQSKTENSSLVRSNSDIARFLNIKQVDLPK